MRGVQYMTREEWVDIFDRFRSSTKDAENVVDGLALNGYVAFKREAPPKPGLATLTFHFDGGGSHEGSNAGWGWVALADDGQIASGHGSLEPGTSNNVAEYRGIIEAMIWLDNDLNVGGLSTQFSRFLFRGDSKLVIEQMYGRWKVKSDNLVASHRVATAMLDDLRKCGLPIELEWVARSYNSAADKLATAAKLLKPGTVIIK